jgi:ribulose-phosphate 3-epimerase
MPKRQQAVKIAASLLAADFRCLRQEIDAVEKAGVNLIHLDVMDGSFVPNISFGPLVVKAVDQLTDLPLEVHLMIRRPDLFAEAFVRSGADTIVIHYEAPVSLHSTLKLIRSMKCRVGMAVNPSTPLAVLEPFYGELDQILLMSVNPGFGGQKFIGSVAEKIKRLRDSLDHQGMEDLEIAVDGGMNPTTAKTVIENGARILVAGSAIFNSPDYEQAVRFLRGTEKEGPCSRN